MRPLTRAILRFRWPVVVAWLLVIVVGGWASTRLSELQSNTFTVPGKDSERVRTLLEQHYGDRPDGSFTVVFETARSPVAGLDAAFARGAGAVPGGRTTGLRRAGDVVFGDIVTTLGLAEAKGYADEVYRAVQVEGITTYVTGPAAIESDLDPIFTEDLQKGESIALPIALLVLLLVFGLSFAVTIPLIFAASTVFGTLGIVYAIAHATTMPTYVTNLVFLIGLGIAVDYSLLIVYRFREELERTPSKDEAILHTMETAGRAVVFSGAAVALGLALLIAMPLPFMRSMGIGGFLIPLVSIAAAVTLQPALLSLYGRGGIRRAAVASFVRGRLRIPLPRFAGTEDVERGFWARLARTIMRRPAVFLALGGTLLIAAAIPLYALQLTPGSTKGIPRHPQSVQGFDALERAVGPGAVSPAIVLVDAGADGAVRAPRVQRAIGGLVARLRSDPEVADVYYFPGGRFVDPSGRYAQLIVPTRHEYGAEESQDFARRLRSDLIPTVRFPDGVRVLAGGGPALGIDFLDQAYGAFPWLVLGVLVLTYLLLLRAFRSVLLPLKAVILNLLSVASSYGLLVVVFKWGVGSDVLGLYELPQIEGWIPIFLFAMLFGLSMDYEVFLVTRMREAWDAMVGDNFEAEGKDDSEAVDLGARRRSDGAADDVNTRAVAIGLERTGRIVTAAAVIMVAAFSGFLAGSIVGLQQFGFGLAVAILVDATIVRALLVPSLMAVMGRYNWWLPAGLARFLRVPPSPLASRT